MKILKTITVAVIFIAIFCVSFGFAAPRAEATVVDTIKTGLEIFSWLNPAGWGYHVGRGAVNIIDNAVAKMFANALGVIYTAVGSIVSFMGILFNGFLTTTSYTNTPLVQEGWKYVLSFANMFFAVILIVIAFATIVGNATYGMKSLLPKLILAAIIINFSLIICGAIIDLSQITMFYFLNKMHPEKGFSQQLMKGMDLAKINELSTKDGKGGWQSKKDKKGDIMTLVINLLFGFCFVIAALLAFAGGISIMIWRMLMLWILVIFAPLAWVASILPQTRKYFSDWWNQFINQVVVGPVYIFFIYLAMLFINPSETGGSGAMAISMAVEPGVGWSKLTLQFMAIIGLMFGGFIAAPKFGNSAANIVMDAAKKAGRSATNWAKGKAGSAATEVGRGIANSSAYQKAANWMASKPIIGGLGTRMQLGSAELTARKQKEIDNSSLKHSTLTAKQQGDAFKSSGKWEDQVAILNNLSKDPAKLAASGLSDAQIKNTLNIAKQRGTLSKETKWANLHHLENADMKETIKNAQGDDFSKLSAKSFGNADVQAAITEQMKNAGSNVRGQHLIDFARKNPTAAPDVRRFLETSPNIHKDIQHEITNNTGKHYLGIGKTKSEIVERETEREMNKPQARQEIEQKVKDERQTELKSHTAYDSIADSTTATHTQVEIDTAKAKNEKLREEMDLEKTAKAAGHIDAAGKGDTSAYLAAKKTDKERTLGRTATPAEVTALRQDEQQRATRQEERGKERAHRETMRNLRKNEIETNLSRDAATAAPGSLAHQYGTAFEFHA